MQRVPAKKHRPFLHLEQHPHRNARNTPAMDTPMRSVLVLSAALLAGPALAQPDDLATWPPLVPRFESTGGGGWMIDGYNPVMTQNRCRTDFAAISPAGEAFLNEAEFDAVPVPGGILCQNGRWRSKDGTGSGTTTLRVFVRADGARFRSPEGR